MVYLVDFEEAVLFCYRFPQFRLTVRTTDLPILPIYPFSLLLNFPQNEATVFPFRYLHKYLHKRLCFCWNTENGIPRRFWGGGTLLLPLSAIPAYSTYHGSNCPFKGSTCRPTCTLTAVFPYSCHREERSLYQHNGQNLRISWLSFARLPPLF